MSNKIRVIKVWRDCIAGFVYLLQEWVEYPRLFNLCGVSSRWENKTMFTTSKKTALKWANHYGVEIQQVADGET